jgi:hypothetical protein
VVKRRAWSDFPIVNHQPAPFDEIRPDSQTLSALAGDGLATLIGKGWSRASAGFPRPAWSMERTR